MRICLHGYGSYLLYLVPTNMIIPIKYTGANTRVVELFQYYNNLLYTLYSIG